MVFKSNEYVISFVDSKDLNEIIEVYNSNKQFLISHMNKEKVEKEWMLEEIESMKRIGFHCCKTVNSITGKIVGLLDFKIDKETYLSLLMIHKDQKNKGIGNSIYQAFERYVQSQDCKSIRIDVVTEYDNSVLDFWNRQGFIEHENIKLNWTGKVLPAITMKKFI
ncbi:MAG TPA: GNAT family N-acetyltransferase [Patescibacteria group bacterium]|nr:GNAT family N-acetyltransferase [Patescibacteria group bacterium]